MSLLASHIIFQIYTTYMKIVQKLVAVNTALSIYLKIQKILIATKPISFSGSKINTFVQKIMDLELLENSMLTNISSHTPLWHSHTTNIQKNTTKPIVTEQFSLLLQMSPASACSISVWRTGGKTWSGSGSWLWHSILSSGCRSWTAHKSQS